MTKAPRAGDVKTRLVPPLTHAEAAQLNTSFLRDTAAAICAAAGGSARCIGVYTPVGIEHTYSDILPLDFDLIPQRGEGFGERLYFATADLFDCGFASVCLIDSDSPTIPVETFSHAVELLQHSGDRVVVGPSDDGGYFLLGLKKVHREMFEQIAWSTERVLDQTLRRAKEIGIKVKMLPQGYDVDDRAALQRLCNELLGENSSPAVGIAPHTREFLSRIIEREGRARIWPA
jgi:hypothetical protein